VRRRRQSTSLGKKNRAEPVKVVAQAREIATEKRNSSKSSRGEQ